MRRVSPGWTTVRVLLIWTAGVVALWVVMDRVLNPGVTEADVLECVEEEFIPAGECEETLEALEAEEDPALAVGASLLVWVAGVFVLLWVLRQPRSAD